MEPVVLKPPKAIFFLPILCLAMFGLGIGMWTDGATALAALCFVLGSVTTFVFVLMAWPGATFLRIDEEGITYTVGGRPTAFAWGEIEALGLAQGNKAYVVGLRLAASHPRRTAAPPQGWDITLPPYSMPAEKLVVLLHERHQLASRR